MNTMAVSGCRPPFTPSQWEELERQALIFKYLIAGSPVPADLLLHLHRSLAASATTPRFYHHPALGYCSYYGKKLDPEPGRCRRTDGKKWRCAKDAHPDSKYCERHMHRSRSRSRKPVESSPTQPPKTTTQSQSPSSSSTVTSLAPSARGSYTGTRSFQSIPLQQPQQHHSVAGGSSLQSSCLGTATASQLNMGLGSYGIANKEYIRFPYGVKAAGNEHSSFSEASGNARGLGVDSSLDSLWLPMAACGSSPLSKVTNNCVQQSAYPQLHSVQDLEQTTINSLSKPQQQYSFFGSDFGSSEPLKLANQSLRPFFDEWPRTKGSWSDLGDEISNHTSFSNTQLAMSIPMASSDFSTTTSRSPNDD